jgi:hypothetical protein
MDRYYVLVAGNGKTSRANIEALLEDHYYAKGKNGTLVLTYQTKPSPEQVYAIQFSKDKEKELLLFTTEGGRFDGAPSASVEISADPVTSAMTFLKGLDASAFLLWADEDTDCQTILALGKDLGVPCFDLTEGLLPLTPSSDIKPVQAPAIPEQETLEYKSKADEEDEEEDDEEEEEEDDDEGEDEEEYEEMDDVYFGLEAIAKFIAKEVAKEVVEQLKKAPEAPQA